MIGNKIVSMYDHYPAMLGEQAGISCTISSWKLGNSTSIEQQPRPILLLGKKRNVM